MNFPHPRRTSEAGTAKTDYSALVARAMAAQATSRTVSALLAGSAVVDSGHVDGLESRMAFFGLGGARNAHGAFLPQDRNRMFESAVNPADSVNGKSVSLDTVKPELQVAERGTEF